MMNRIIKHTVLVMTYRQEEYIALCLDSILAQSVMPYEIVVCDDSSPDRTWAIVEQYVNKYPNIIKAHRNEKNMGVFRNYNQMIRRVTGDFVNIVAGDDMLPQGALEAYDKFIEEQNLDCAKPFIVYTNADVFLPDGSLRHYNNYQYCNVDPMELTLMCEFYHWDTGMSAELVRTMPDIRTDIGYQADWLQHVQRIICCNKQYFIDVTGYVYRQGIGVTVSERGEIQRDSLLGIINIYRNEYPQIINAKVARFFWFTECYFAYLKHNSMKSYMTFFLSRIRLGRMRKSSSYYRNWKILVPIALVKFVKMVIGKK